MHNLLWVQISSFDEIRMVCRNSSTETSFVPSIAGKNFSSSAHGMKNQSQWNVMISSHLKVGVSHEKLKMSR